MSGSPNCYREINMNNVGPTYEIFTHTVIVTGAAGDTGKKIAEQLAANGVNLVLADIDAAATLDVRNDINQNNGNAIAVCVDVRDLRSVETLVSIAEQHFGRIDSLIHCSGANFEKSFLETSLQEWRDVIDLELTGTFLCFRAVSRAMAKNRQGSIIFVSTSPSQYGKLNRAALIAAKSAVMALIQSVSVELRDYGITVSAMTPETIESELTPQMLSPES